MATKSLILLLSLLGVHGQEKKTKGTDDDYAQKGGPHGHHGAGIPGIFGGPLGLPGAPFGSALAMMSTDDMPGMTISFGSDPTDGSDGAVMTIGGVMGGPGSDVMELDDLQSIFGGHTGTQGHKPGEAHHGRPDPFIGDILGAMDSAITSQLLPLGHKHQEDPPCEEDEKKLCPRSVFKSPLQCLGKYADQVSEKCKKDVKMSLPFNCANELSEGCDGVDESIISCLSNRMTSKSGKSLSDGCKGSLEVTQSLVHKVNTLSSTVISTSVVNDTHVAQTKTTRTKDAVGATPWTCPDGFANDGTAEAAVNGRTCCAASNSLVYPRMQCKTSGGSWNLISPGGPHGGFQCCAADGKTVSKTKILSKAVSAFKAGMHGDPDSPFGVHSSQELSAKSLLAIIAVSVMVGMGIRAVAPTAVYTFAQRMGVPSAILKQPQWKVDKPNKEHQMSPVVEQEQYGSV